MNVKIYNFFIKFNDSYKLGKNILKSRNTRNCVRTLILNFITYIYVLHMSNNEMPA